MLYKDIEQRLVRISDGDGGSQPPDPTATGGTNGTTPPPAGDDGNGAGTLTQAQVDELVGRTRTKARDTGRTALLQELGFASAEEAATYLTGARTADDKDKSELQLANERLATLDGIEATSTAQAEQITSYETAVTSQVEALKKSLTIPDFVVSLLDGMTPIEQLTYISKHQEDFSKPAKPTKPNINSGDGGSTPKTPDPKARKKALRKRFSHLRD